MKRFFRVLLLVALLFGVIEPVAAVFEERDLTQTLKVLKVELKHVYDRMNRAKAMLSDGTVLCEAVSKSWRYARTKVTKMALNLLAMPSRKYLLSNPEYQARVGTQKG